ncbi:hypothetical protein B1A99_29645 [Cohnella sp. CIP 111063]|nr:MULTISPECIES: glycosylhydrolase-like jelly roll fold domain-containing protein [unclassified Cohnella]OXS53588.1 hypothetical protein B1A99_29645 [Cohnella sp. CIP 111063]
MREHFVNPSAEYSPLPFWFWNDELSRDELIRQIRDFHEKEVDGFVLHPRMGLPRSLPYLSEPFMELVDSAVAEADKLGMKVILYDEGMYPSGSACGMVVKTNPEYASRGLQIRELSCKAADGIHEFPIALLPGETLISVQAVRKASPATIDPERTVVLEPANNRVRFAPSESGEWSVLLFVETYSRGTIRGIHAGQDDGEPDAPLAADLLNPDAVQAFISLTHDRYYEKLSRYFGTTVIAFFTDEPDLLGRGHIEGLKPWTRGFLDEFLAGGGAEKDLPLLWYAAGAQSVHTREIYDTAVRNRMARTYYKRLADWCENHGIGLTGHPAGSDDIGLLQHFHIPGQDVVWRYIAPEKNKGVTGVHSTMGKCSSDSARHRGKRRNMNEAFGVCGIEGGWSLTADNMKWYLDWLFVRGVNLISPHAFYYSIREERRDERPPDVGPHNIWWPEYARFSRYIKRMSWLMTDSANEAEVAVLAGEASLPWRLVKPLYERQIEFNYLEDELFRGSCDCKDGMLEIAGYRYRAVLVDGERQPDPESWNRLEAFCRQGGVVIELVNERGGLKDIGQIRVSQAEAAADALARELDVHSWLEPASPAIRISCVKKDDCYFYVLVNEGEDEYEGAFGMKYAGYAEFWRPWTGQCEAVRIKERQEGQAAAVRIERRECLIVAVDPSREPVRGDVALNEWTMTEDLSSGWRVAAGPRTGDLPELESWTNWDGMGHYSGTVAYENIFDLDHPGKWEQIELDLGEAHEFVRLEVNGREVGCQMWKPYRFGIGRELKPGLNVLRVSVTNSLANRYDGKSLPSGLLGPVRLRGAGLK